MARKFLSADLANFLQSIHRHTPLQRRLQTLAICIYLFMFLLLATLCGILTVWLWFTPLYFIILVYAVWLVYDFRTPERGGRRCEWIRSWKIWNYCRDYFPVTLKSTCSLDPDRNYMMIYHPHGILAFGVCINFASNATDVYKHFPGIRCSTAAVSFQFLFPLCRECVMSLGMCYFMIVVSSSPLPSSSCFLSWYIY